MKSFFKVTMTIALSVIACSAIIGCSTISRKYDEPRASKISKVAILSFEILQEQPKDALGIAKLGELKSGRPADMPEMQTMAANTYNELALELGKRTGWKVVSLKELGANKEYAK